MDKEAYIRTHDTMYVFGEDRVEMQGEAELEDLEKRSESLTGTFEILNQLPSEQAKLILETILELYKFIQYQVLERHLWTDQTELLQRVDKVREGTRGHICLHCGQITDRNIEEDRFNQLII